MIPIKKNGLKKDAYRNLALISQLGISMIVPIFLLLALGIYLENKFGIFAILPCVILGMLSGCRNAYFLMKKANGKSDGEKQSKEEQEVVDKALREWNDGKQFAEKKDKK